jgi:metal-sulfur cluster biosynthetic enzyme
MAAQQSVQRSSGRVAEITALLGAVSDPELDEPVTELGFVTSIAVSEEGAVEIDFRLPTYWCAANFAYLMAEDMRAAAGALPWVRSVRVVLDEHMYAEAVNRGMEEGHSFQQAFGAEADGDLAELRRVFALKAFQRRQLALIEHLLGSGHAAPALLTLSVAGLRGLALGGAGERLRARYFEKRPIVGPAEGSDPAFVGPDGAAIEAASLPAHLRACRRVAVNAEFNGALCRGLLVERYGEESCRSAGMIDVGAHGDGVMADGRGPTLRDFLLAAAREEKLAAARRRPGAATPPAG